MSREELERQLAALREGFRGEVAERRAAIAAAWRAIEAEGWADDRAEVVERLSHSLAGSAATFGFPGLSEAARVVELAVEAVRKAGAPATGDLPRIAGLLAALDAAEG
jgi:chemotaxis protein histidine kinase CheA